MDLHTMEVSGLELLARWRDRNGGTEPPDRFMPLIEASALERVLVRGQLAQAAAAVARFPRFHGSFSINASQWLLCQAGFGRWFERTMRRLGLSPHRLVLEVTERHDANDSESAVIHAHVALLTKVGVRLSLDDFGVGSATLRTLDLYAFTLVKIDKQFLHRARVATRSIATLRGMVDLIHSMGAKATVEGVETLDDLLLAKTANADCAQGYFIGFPCEMERIKVAFGKSVNERVFEPGNDENREGPAGWLAAGEWVNTFI